jgi:hypothetical protein
VLVCRAEGDGLALEATQDDFAVRYHVEGERPPEPIAFRSSLLADFEGRTDEPVLLEPMEGGKGRARWNDGGVPRVLDFETVAANDTTAFPELPQELVSQPAGFLHALGEAAQVASREASRLALSRVQLQGKGGKVVCTDGRELLVQAGFSFPWPNNVLVPRVAAFGSPDVVREEPVKVGRTEDHVAVRAGPWTFVLAIDKDSRFPDVASVIPLPSAAVTRLQLEPADAAFLTRVLPRLPESDDEGAGGITLDLGTPVAVRARGQIDGPATEVVLARSTVTGPPHRLRLSRSHLQRTLHLGFTEIVVSRADRPVLCRSGPHT